MRFYQLHIGLLIVLFIMLAMSCERGKTSLVLAENAPEQTMKNATIQHTDSGRLQMIMWGEEIWNYDDEDQTQEFPNNVRATFYDENGTITSIITADEGTNWQRKNLMQLRGNVIIEDLRDGKRTYTEEFFWDQNARKIYSNVAVLQKHRDGSWWRGTGFESDDQMENFVIFHMRAEFNID